MNVSRCTKAKTLLFFACIWGVFIGAGGCGSSLPQTAHAHAFALVDTLQFPNLTYLIKDTSLLRQIQADSGGVSITPVGVSEANWKIYPDEYALTSKLLNCVPADRMWELLQEKKLGRWTETHKALASCTFSSYVPTVDSLRPLEGLRVALDPGHMAGDIRLAEVEGKYMKMRASRRTRFEPIQFFEANLTLATAHLIKSELEQLGATVLLTRTASGEGALGLSYEDWKQEEWEKLMDEEILAGTLTESEKANWKLEKREDLIMGRFFTPQDLRARARKINDFRPHLTLIIHFNIHEPNWHKRDKWGFFEPAEENYSMAFVPGSFMQGELSDSIAQVDFLRLLLSQDIPKSTVLSEAFVRYSALLTGVEAVSPDRGLNYLDRASILTSHPGVYARNLSLTRMIRGPVCYGESLCQDHVKETRRLNQKNIKVAGIWVSARLEWVAKAYVEAVKDFARSY